MTNALSGFGTVLTWNGQPIAEVKKIGGPKIKINTINVTNHSSPSAFAEFIGGIGDGGEIIISGNLIPGDINGQNALIADAIAKTVGQAIVTGPGGIYTWTANALVADYEPTQDFDTELSFSATLKITGVPVLGYTAAPNLTALTLTTATLIPTFAGGTYSYSATTTGTSETVTPTCATADSITVNGSVVASGVPSSAILTPSVGNYAVQVVVIKAGTASKIYNITLVKTA